MGDVIIFCFDPACGREILVPGSRKSNHTKSRYTILLLSGFILSSRVSEFLTISLDAGASGQASTTETVVTRGRKQWLKLVKWTKVTKVKRWMLNQVLFSVKRLNIQHPERNFQWSRKRLNWKTLDLGHWVLDIGCSEFPIIVRLRIFENPAALKSILSHPRERFDFAQRDRGMGWRNVLRCSKICKIHIMAVTLLSSGRFNTDFNFVFKICLFVWITDEADYTDYSD